MVYICADDYGMTEKSCGRIEECVKNGVLNRISIFPNTSLSDIKERIKYINASLSAHINLVEGKPVSPAENVSLITDKRGYFRYSFIGLLALSLSPERKELERQIYTEISAQLACWSTEIAPGKPLEIDSHQHTHMIPLIFKILMRVIKDKGYDVKYIRIPTEPVIPYLKELSLYKTYSLINTVKQFLLKFFGLINKRALKKSNINSALFMGILFSGNMDEYRVNKILPHYLKLCEKTGRDAELLFHPGYIEKGEELFDTEKQSFNKFYHSPGRKTEYATLKNLIIKQEILK